MGKISAPRYGSLQFWPRKRAEKEVASVNWDAVPGDGFLAMLSYKVGMGTAIVRDKTDKSLTINKKIAIPVTILEVPPINIFSVRFYKHGKVMKEIVVGHDKELVSILKTPKTIHGVDKLDSVTGWDELRVLVHSNTKNLFKKTPDIAEIRVHGKDALELVKKHIGKEIKLADLLGKWDLVDVRGLTKGKGLSGPVKRYGISLKSHKSEKGVRRPGSLGPWHPARVTFRVSQAGQLGMFTRVHYNLRVLSSGSHSTESMIHQKGFKHYGKVRGDYVMVVGSVQGAPKRQIIITPALRPTKHKMKKKYELVELHL